jgi:nitroreductase
MDDEWIYTDSYIATAISEFFVQLISAVFVGVTWRRFPNEVIRDHMKARVNCLLAAPAMAFLGWFMVPIWNNRNSFAIRGSEPGWVGVTIYAVLYLGVVGLMTYGASWYYWTGFLNLPGSL